MVAHMLSRMTRARHIVSAPFSSCLRWPCLACLGNVVVQNNGIAMPPIPCDRAPFPAMGNITVFALVDQDPRLWNRGFQP